MINAIVGTAGHVDHGKTSLIKALSGIDTDRLMEEKKRGITIELGFANLQNDRGEHIGIIDVPGHEKFVKNMLAGIGGIDLVLLVVALDEGVMPQTIEHFEILKMLGIKKGIIVLTKSDLADKDSIEIVNRDIDELVKNSFLENASRINVSIVNSENLDKLKNMIFDELMDVTAKSHAKEMMRLPVDRVFTIEGFGTVITGTLMEGIVNTNDELMLYPSQTVVKVRNIQSHSIDTNEAYAGQRVAINLLNVKKTDIERGEVLAAKDSMLVTKDIDVYVKMFHSSNRKIKNGDKIHFNFGSKQTEAKIYLLSKDTLTSDESDFAHIVFDNEVAMKKNDKFIIRYFSPMESMGGGYVIDPYAIKHKRKDEAVINYLNKMSSASPIEQVKLFISHFSNSIIDEKMLRLRLHMTKEEVVLLLSEALKDNSIVRVDKDNYISKEYYDNLVSYATSLLDDFHKANPVLKGMNKEEFKNKLANDYNRMGERLRSPSLLSGDKQTELLMNMLLENKKITSSDGLLQKPGFSGGINDKNQIIADKIEKIYKTAGIEVSKVDDVLAEFKDKKLARQVLNDLAKNHKLIKIDNDNYMHTDNFNLALDKIYKFYENNKELTLADVRDMLSTSRKYALFILDTTDRLKITKRVGDARVLIKQMKL